MDYPEKFKIEYSNAMAGVFIVFGGFMGLVLSALLAFIIFGGTFELFYIFLAPILIWVLFILGKAVIMLWSDSFAGRPYAIVSHEGIQASPLHLGEFRYYNWDDVYLYYSYRQYGFVIEPIEKGDESFLKDVFLDMVAPKSLVVQPSMTTMTRKELKAMFSFYAPQFFRNCS